MNARRNVNVMLLMLAMLCLLASTGALAGKPSADGDRDSDKPKDPPDQRMLASLREYMDVSDTEWQVLLPQIMKVQELNRARQELRAGGSAFGLPKPFKLPKEFRADAAPEADRRAEPPPSWTLAVADVNEKARELRTLMQDRAARAADIRTKLAAFRVARAEAEKRVAGELAQARAKLTELLTVRQELVCVVGGLLE